MTHLSLFSGVGGIDLAAHWAGFETVAFVERDQFCQKVLAKNFPGVPIYDDVTTFDGTGYRGRIDLLSGGFPCQDISCANKRATGLDGARSGLFFEMLRVIEQARPTFIVAENVRNLLNMGIDICLSRLEALGYETTAIIVPAAGVGAWHRRDRIFIVGANFDSVGVQSVRRASGAIEQLHHDRFGNGGVEKQARVNEFCGVGSNTPGPRPERPQSNQGGTERGKLSPWECHEFFQGFGERSRIFEPKLCGNLHGLPGGLDVNRNRLKALGNAVVPQQVYPILKAIAECIQEAAP